MEFFKKRHERTALAIKNISLSFIAKGISVLITLAYVPLLLNELNQVKYGIWLTISSIITLLGISDVGLGNGMKNLLASSLAKNEDVIERKIVSTTYVLISIISFILFVSFFIISKFIKWDIVLNAPSEMRKELSLLMLVVFSLFCIQLILKIITSILDAFQLSGVSSLVLLIGQFLSFLSVFVLSKCTINSPLLTYGFVISISPILTLFLASVFLFSKKFSFIRPSLNFYDKLYSKEIVNIGLKFFTIQLTSILLYQSNNLIIAHVVGPSEVTTFNIAYKYCGLIHMLFLIILSPIWVATTDAYIKKDYNWIKNSINKLNKSLIIIVLILIIQLIFSKQIYNLWLGNALIIKYSTTFLLLFYFLLGMRSSIYCNVINGTGKIFFQFIITSFEVLIHIPLSIILGKQFGINGVILSMIFIMILNILWMPFQYNKIINNKARGILNR